MKQKPFTELIQKFVSNKCVLKGQIALTNRCNENCIHCLICKKHPAQLSTHEAKDAIKQLRDLGCLVLNISGGEPLLHPGFFEIAEFAKKLNISLSINSNGTLINRAVAKRLQALRPDPIQISLYAHDAKTHDQTTRLPGSHKKTISAIETLREFGVKVNIAHIAMRHNFKQFFPLRKYARKIKAEYGFDILIRPTEQHDKAPLQHRITNEQLRLAQRLKLISMIKAPHHRQKKASDLKTKLPSLLFSMYISYTADVYPSILYLNKAGNMREQTLRTIWTSSPVFENLRNIPFGKFQCSRCRHIKRCCPDFGLAFSEHGDFLARPLEFCRFISAMTHDEDIDSWIKKK